MRAADCCSTSCQEIEGHHQEIEGHHQEIRCTQQMYAQHPTRRLRGITGFSMRQCTSECASFGMLHTKLVRRMATCMCICTSVRVHGQNHELRELVGDCAILHKWKQDMPVQESKAGLHMPVHKSKAGQWRQPNEHQAGT
eukprot:scaffold102494_cov19-Tisochrysis_lutea.AAC.2